MKKMSWMLMIVLLAVMVAACGTNGSGSSNNAAGGANSGDAKNANTAAPKDGEELTIKHKLGETKVKKNPQKVVVFDFGTLDSLDKLGVEVAGVPSKNLPSYLSKYKDSKYANVGGLMEPDFEMINQLKPDLIIISARQSAKYEEFKAIAPTIFMGVDDKSYMKSFEENVKLVKEAQLELIKRYTSYYNIVTPFSRQFLNAKIENFEIEPSNTAMHRSDMWFKKA